VRPALDRPGSARLVTAADIPTGDG